MASDWFYRFLLIPVSRVFAILLLTLLGPFRWFGSRRVPRRGGVLILANHLADVDPIVVQAACPRPIFFMAKSELFEMPILRSFLKLFRAFPVKRGEPDRSAIKRAVELLKQGHAVCVFPEGQLSEDGNLQELKAGVGLIARMADVPVQCVRIRNSNRVMPYGSLIPRPALAWVDAHWGEPKSFERGDSAETITAWAADQLASL